MQTPTRFLVALTVGIILFSATVIHAATFTATSLNDLQTKLDSARDGDVINLQAKRYSGKKRLFIRSGVTIRGKGKSTIIDGEIEISVSAPNATIDNMKFDGVRPFENRERVISVWRDGFTLNRVRVENMRANDSNAATFLVSGSDVRNCKFRFSTFIRNTLKGSMLVLRSSPTRSTPSNHEVRGCYFSGPGPQSRANGNEAIGLGSNLGNGGSRVLYSIFEDWDAEVEIVSVKSSNNLIRGCLFRRCYGALSLRAGHRNRVEECYFLDGKYGDRSTFINIWGDGHRVTHNYFGWSASGRENSDGLRNSGIITLKAGTGRSINSMFEAAEGVLIANNFVGPPRGSSPGLGIGGDIGSRTTPVRDCTIRSNYFWGYSANKNKRIDADNNPLASIDFSDNRAWPVAGISVNGVSSRGVALVKDPQRGNLRFDPNRLDIGPSFNVPTDKGAPF